MSITVKEWITYKKAEAGNYDVFYRGIGGWFDEGHRWKDYIEVFDDKVKPYLEAIRKEIVKNNYKFGGYTHQLEMIPIFSDNTIGFFSYRAWGDLMSAIWAEEENKDYNYMDFYMT